MLSIIYNRIVNIFRTNIMHDLSLGTGAQIAVTAKIVSATAEKGRFENVSKILSMVSKKKCSSIWEIKDVSDTIIGELTMTKDNGRDGSNKSGEIRDFVFFSVLQHILVDCNSVSVQSTHHTARGNQCPICCEQRKQRLLDG